MSRDRAFFEQLESFGYAAVSLIFLALHPNRTSSSCFGSAFQDKTVVRQLLVNSPKLKHNCTEAWALLHGKKSREFLSHSPTIVQIHLALGTQAQYKSLVTKGNFAFSNMMKPAPEL